MYRFSNLFLSILILSVLQITLSSLWAQSVGDKRLQPYVEVLKNEGVDPVMLVLDKLKTHDLLIFDDAWHPAVEPFEFYQNLIKNPSFSTTVTYIFIEVFPINKQNYIDSYLNASQEDKKVLYPLFQDDFSGQGWPLKTYIDLMETIYYVNSRLPQEERFSVIAVNSPTYWSEINTPEDFKLFRKTLVGNDYTMYKTILEALNNFGSDQKGIFLTNTRHAYKGIKPKTGDYFWNCGTFFHQWHPGKSYSIRFHNIALFIEAEKRINPNEATTTAGMEKINYKWIRMANGLWDTAFRENGNIPVAISLKNNVFGSEAYIGNHMHKAAPNQTMYDANDALIFIEPLEALHTSARVADIYTPEFKEELARRYQILYSAEQLEKMYISENVKNLKELIDIKTTPEDEQFIRQVNSLEAIDAWKHEN